MKTKTNKPLKSTLILRHPALKALKETRFKLTPHSIIQDSTPQNISINRNNDSCITVDTTKKIRCVFNSGPLSKLKSDTWEKTQSTNIYRPQYHVNRFDPKRDSRNILPFIQLHAAQSSWNSQAKTVSTFTNINTLTFLTSHTTVTFSSFLTDTTRQATIPTQPHSSNIFVQHDKDIIT